MSKNKLYLLYCGASLAGKFGVGAAQVVGRYDQVRGAGVFLDQIPDCLCADSSGLRVVSLADWHKKRLIVSRRAAQCEIARRL